MKCKIMNLKEIKNIGFIGLGVMGSPMCKNLLKNKQWQIVVHDLDTSKEKEVKKIMRTKLKPKSYKNWRKRVHDLGSQRATYK